MAVSRRTVLSAVVLVLLGVFVAIGFWYQSRQVAPSEADDTAAIAVTNGADRGAGSLREALFIAAAAKGPQHHFRSCAEDHVGDGLAAHRQRSRCAPGRGATQC